MFQPAPVEVVDLTAEVEPMEVGGAAAAAAEPAPAPARPSCQRAAAADQSEPPIAAAAPAPAAPAALAPAPAVPPAAAAAAAPAAGTPAPSAAPAAVAAAAAAAAIAGEERRWAQRRANGTPRAGIVERALSNAVVSLLDITISYIQNIGVGIDMKSFWGVVCSEASNECHVLLVW